MENDRVLIGALIFFLLIVGSNLIMYGVVRGMTRSGGSNWVNTLRNSFGKPRESSSGRSMDELRKKVEELEGKKQDET